MSRITSPKKRNTMITTSTTTLRSSSPLKMSRDADETMMSMQQDNTMLQMQMGEKDVEMERMTTTLTALNGKLTILTDIRNDIDQHKEYLENSEEQRELL